MHCNHQYLCLISYLTLICLGGKNPQNFTLTLYEISHLHFHKFHCERFNSYIAKRSMWEFNTQNVVFCQSTWIFWLMNEECIISILNFTLMTKVLSHYFTLTKALSHYFTFFKCEISHCNDKTELNLQFVNTSVLLFSSI